MDSDQLAELLLESKEKRNMRYLLAQMQEVVNAITTLVERVNNIEDALVAAEACTVNAEAQK